METLELTQSSGQEYSSDEPRKDLKYSKTFLPTTFILKLNKTTDNAESSKRRITL